MGFDGTGISRAGILYSTRVTQLPERCLGILATV